MNIQYLFFSAFIGCSFFSASAQSPILVKDVNPGPEGSKITAIAAGAGGKLFFSANYKDNGELWISDGTEKGTSVLAKTEGAINHLALHRKGFIVYDAVADDKILQLRRNDGKSEESALLYDFSSGGGSLPHNFIAFGNYIYFSRQYTKDDVSFSQLWRTDGTPEGTSAVVTFEANLLIESDLFLAQKKFYFVLHDANKGEKEGYTLYSSDGTNKGTQTAEEPVQLTAPYTLTVWKDQLYFGGYDKDNNQGLCTFDGKETRLVSNLLPDHLFAMKDRLLFSAEDGKHGKELWSSMGTEETTVLLKDIYTGDNSSSPFLFTGTGQWPVYFVASAEETGDELYKLNDPTLPGKTVAAGEANKCITYPDVTIKADNNNQWVDITDNDGNIIAQVNAHGNELGTITPALYINQGDPRTIAEGYYLDRSITLHISPEPEIADSVEVRFFITGQEYEDLKKVSDLSGGLHIFKNQDMCSEKIQNTDVLAVTTTMGKSEENGYYYIAGNIGSFSSFYFTGAPSVTLPVILVDFDAKLSGNKAQITWKTTSEENTDRFSIQRSADGRVFESIGQVAATGNSNSIRSYSYSDAGVIQLKERTLYYRLVITDKDGKTKYSSVVLLFIPGRQRSLILKNNPIGSQAELTYESPVNGKATIRIWDVQARPVVTKTEIVKAGFNSIILNTATLSPGIYTIEVRTENGERNMLKMLKRGPL